MDMGTGPPTMGTGTPPTTATATPLTEWRTLTPVGDTGTTHVAPTMATRMRLESRMVGTIRVARIVPTRWRRDGEVTTGAGADKARRSVIKTALGVVLLASPDPPFLRLVGAFTLRLKV